MIIVNYSGVFRISVRRGRGAVGVERGVMWWSGLDPSAEKKSFFFPKMVSFDAVFNRQKTLTVTRSLGTLRFNCETKLTKTVQKLSKIHSQTKEGGGASHHRPLNTPLVN